MRQRLLQKRKAAMTKEGNGGFFGGWNIFGAGKKSQDDDVMLSLNRE